MDERKWWQEDEVRDSESVQPLMTNESQVGSLSLSFYLPLFLLIFFLWFPLYLAATKKLHKQR
jgi:hypothetical protein